VRACEASVATYPAKGVAARRELVIYWVSTGRKGDGRKLSGLLLEAVWWTFNEAGVGLSLVVILANRS
jgi:hypothetical protein